MKSIFSKAKELIKKNSFLEKTVRRLITLVPYSLRKLDKEFWAYYRFLFEIEKKTLKQVQAYQLESLQALLQNAYSFSSFYKNKFDQADFHPSQLLSLDDLYKIPKLSRAEVREHASEMLLNRCNIKQMHCAHTSGTTGKAVTLYLNKKVESKEWASICYQWSRVGYKPGDGRIELRGFVGRNADYDYLPDEKVLRINILKMSEANIQKIVKKINQVGYAFVHGYPSAVLKFAKIIKESGNSLNLQAVLLASEVLYDWQLSEIEEILNCKIMSHYGQAEKVALGAWDIDRRYYFIPAYGIVEYDHENLELIGTSLINDAMPMIRYQLTDSIENFQFENMHSCKSLYPVIDIIHGREEDNTFNENGQIVPPALVTFPFKRLKFVLAAKLTQYQINQFELLFETQTEEASVSLKTEVVTVISDLKKIYGSNAHFDVRFTDKIPLNKSGKFRWIECRINA